MPETKDFYTEANLKGNPFRSNSVQETDPRSGIWVGYDKEKRTFWKFLERTRADQVGNANFLMLYGDYGTGKSHALLWARHQILEAEKKAFNSACYYIQSLRKDGKIAFAGAFRDDILGKSTLVDDVLAYRQFLTQRAVMHGEQTGKPPGTSTTELARQLIGSVELSNTAEAILACSRKEEVEELLAEGAAKDYGAMTLFSRLVNLFVHEMEVGGKRERFRKAAYLFIDELDLLATSTVKETRDTNELLRHLYDNCPNCFCLVLGFTATAAEVNVLFTDYVTSRVTKTVVMQNLDTDDARAFVKEILDASRVEKKRGKAGYYPFSENAIDTVLSDIVAITPRKVVNVMQQVLEEVRLRGWSESNGVVDSKYLEKNDIMEDISGA
jgi:hypothetical protein